MRTHRRVRLTASTAVVVGTIMQTTALFLTVTTTTLTTRTTTLVSVLCVPAQLFLWWQESFRNPHKSF